MRLYRAIWTAADGNEHVSVVTATTDKNGNEPNASEVAGHMFDGVPDWKSEPVIIFETFLH